MPKALLKLIGSLCFCLFVHICMEFSQGLLFLSTAMKLVNFERIEYFLESSMADFSSKESIRCLATNAWIVLV